MNSSDTASAGTIDCEIHGKMMELLECKGYRVPFIHFSVPSFESEWESLAS